MLLLELSRLTTAAARCVLLGLNSARIQKCAAEVSSCVFSQNNDPTGSRSRAIGQAKQVKGGKLEVVRSLISQRVLALPSWSTSDSVVFCPTDLHAACVEHLCSLLDYCTVWHGRVQVRQPRGRLATPVGLFDLACCWPA